MIETIGNWLVPPGVENVVLFLAAGSVSAILFSLAKSGFGGSVGILAVPVMIFACGGQTRVALGLLLPMLIAADYVAVVLWWRKWDGRAVLRLMPGAALGIGLSWAALWALREWDVGATEQTTDAVLKLGIGLISLGFVALQAVRAVRGTPLKVRLTWPRMLAVGAVAGLTSTIAHAAGPVVAMYMLSLALPKGRYVASIALVFWTVNHAKLPAYLHLGMIDWDTLGATVLLVPAIAVGAVAGWLLHRRLGPRSFAGVVYTLLAIAGAGLIWKGLEALLS
jgi:hypothetical protein